MVVVLSEWLFFQSRAETIDQRHHGEAHQRADLPLGGRVGEQSKRCPGVLHVGQMKEAGNNNHAVAQRDIAGDSPFRQAIQKVVPWLRSGRNTCAWRVVAGGYRSCLSELTSPVRRCHPEERSSGSAVSNLMSCGRRFDFRQNRAATLTHRGIVPVFAHVGGIVPAAFAFLARSLTDCDRQAGVAIARLKTFSNTTSETMKRYRN